MTSVSPHHTTPHHCCCCDVLDHKNNERLLACNALERRVSNAFNTAQAMFTGCNLSANSKLWAAVKSLLSVNSSSMNRRLRCNSSFRPQTRRSLKPSSSPSPNSHLVTSFRSCFKYSYCFPWFLLALVKLETFGHGNLVRLVVLSQRIHQALQSLVGRFCSRQQVTQKCISLSTDKQ